VAGKFRDSLVFRDNPTDRNGFLSLDCFQNYLLHDAGFVFGFRHHNCAIDNLRCLDRTGRRISSMKNKAGNSGKMEAVQRIDPDVAEIAKRWSKLSKAIKRAIMALAGTGKLPRWPLTHK
jgi:hypothetical protein